MSILNHDHDDNSEERSLGSMLFGPKMGTWSVHSDIDPRWNKTGRSEGLICTGGPADMRAWIDECYKRFGPKCPADCTYSFMKD